MPPKSFKPVPLDEPTITERLDHAERQEPHYGEQHVFNSTVPYGGGRRVVNATVNPAELQRGIAKQKSDFAKMVSQHQEFKRVKKGKRVVKHRLPVEEEYAENGDVILKRKSTATTRMEH
ncbi:MAG: hypothetical protein NDI90_15515 [Nitrospira sp. BO4]|nr:hypothetical protein [Nitrospira sp. BO4]